MLRVAAASPEHQVWPRVPSRILFEKNGVFLWPLTPQRCARSARYQGRFGALSGISASWLVVSEGGQRQDGASGKNSLIFTHSCG